MQLQSVSCFFKKEKQEVSISNVFIWYLEPAPIVVMKSWGKGGGVLGKSLVQKPESGFSNSSQIGLIQIQDTAIPLSLNFF